MSLRARLLAAFAYTLLIVIVALEVPLAANISDRVNAEVEADSAAQAQVVAASIVDQLDRPAQLEQLTNQAAEGLNGVVFVIDAHGTVIADSEGGASASGQVNDPIALQALGGEVAQGRHHEGEDVLSTAVPIVRNGRTVGALEVEQSLSSVHSEVRQDVAALIGIGVLALLLGLGVAWILAGSISRPLNALAAVARRRADGDVEARAESRGSSEQIEVANAFNEMADRLGALLESQRVFVADASHQLRTPLTGLRLRLEAAGVKTSDPAVARELDAAERETERLDELVADLLQLASSEQPATDESASLSDAARDAADRWRATASEGRHEIVLEGDGEASVGAAPSELAAILDNLVENAIKYSPRGSPVTIRCERDNGMAQSGSAERVRPARPRGREARVRALLPWFRQPPWGHGTRPADRRRPGQASWRGGDAPEHGCRARSRRGPAAGLELCQLLTRPPYGECMTTRERTLTVLLGIAGILAAAAIALAANAISGREIGLSAEPVSLAAAGTPAKPAPGAREDRRVGREDSSGDDSPLASDDSASGGSSNAGPSSSGDDKGAGSDDRGRSPSDSGTSGTGSGSTPQGSPPPTTTTEDHSGHGGGGGDDPPEGGGNSGPG